MMTTDQLVQAWRSMINGFVPCREQFALWLCTHDDDTVFYGITETAKKFLRENGQMADDHLVRYASKVMSNRALGGARPEEKPHVGHRRRKVVAVH